MPSWKSCASARTKKKPSPEKGPFSVDGKQFTQFFVPARRYVRDFAQVRENRSLHPSTSGPDRDAQAVLAGPHSPDPCGPQLLWHPSPCPDRASYVASLNLKSYESSLVLELSAPPDAALIPVMANHQRVQRHRAHKAAKHHRPKRPHHRRA